MRLHVLKKEGSKTAPKWGRPICFTKARPHFGAVFGPPFFKTCRHFLSIGLCVFPEKCKAHAAGVQSRKWARLSVAESDVGLKSESDSESELGSVMPVGFEP